MSKLKAIMDSATATLSSGGGTGDLPRRRVEIIFEPDDCRPGVFEETFTITLEELTSKAELEAVRLAKGDPISAALLQAQRAIVEFDGERVGRVQREWLVEALGARGRNKLAAGFVELVDGGGRPSEDEEDGEGKA